MVKTVEIVKNTPVSSLGESPVWHPLEKVLYWIDITGGKLHRYNPEDEKCKTFDMGCMIGSVVPAHNKYSLIVAFEKGIYGYTLNGKLEKLSEYPVQEMENNRFNDGKCDPAGRLWIGTMNKEVIKEAGNLYSFDGNNLKLKQSGITISNGIAWSNDNKIMYYIDTFEYTIYKYDFDNITGSISNRQTAIMVPKQYGAPDGMTIDSDGMLWVAHWGGSAIRCWNPDSGKMIHNIDIPAPHVTSCTFGGKNLNTLYITSAREGLSKMQLNNFPKSGSVFKIKLNFKGSSSHYFKEPNK
jgi:sugar lactone lactonase YvrE